MNSYKISWSWIHMWHFMTYEFIYEFMYMKNIVKSYLNSGVPRFQMLNLNWWCAACSGEIYGSESALKSQRGRWDSVWDARRRGEWWTAGRCEWLGQGRVSRLAAARDQWLGSHWVTPAARAWVTVTPSRAMAPEWQRTAASDGVPLREIDNLLGMSTGNLSFQHACMSLFVQLEQS